MPNRSNPRLTCQNCGERFPNRGFEQPLLVNIGWRGVSQSHFLCLQCRRKAYNTFQEPLPPGVDAYTDHIHGHTIVPRITETEARRQYCLTDCHFRDIPHVITAYSVRSAGHVYKVKLYEERDIVRVARRVWGGDVGISNARECYSWQNGGVTYTPMPPVGIERLRRDRIRQAFLDWGFYFATPTLPCVSNYVNYGQGQLSRIVAIYGN